MNLDEAVEEIVGVAVRCGWDSDESRESVARIVRFLLEGKALSTHRGIGKKDIALRPAVVASSDRKSRQAKYRAAKAFEVESKAFYRKLIKSLNALRDGDIDFEDFSTGAKEILYILYQTAYHYGTLASGHGKLLKTEGKKLSSEDMRFIDSAYKEEMGYFEKVLRGIEDDPQAGQWDKRIRNYFDSARAMLDAGEVANTEPGVIFHWVLQSPKHGGKPCPECLLLSSLSPFPRDLLPTTPKAGSTRCLNRCFCLLRREKVEPIKVLELRKRLGSREYLVRKLKQSRKTKPKK